MTNQWMANYVHTFTVRNKYSSFQSIVAPLAYKQVIGYVLLNIEIEPCGYCVECAKNSSHEIFDKLVIIDINSIEIVLLLNSQQKWKVQIRPRINFLFQYLDLAKTNLDSASNVEKTL